MYQNCGYRASSFIQFGFQDKSPCAAVRIGFQFHNLGSKDDHFHQIFQAFSCLGRYRNKDGAAAPVLWNQLVLGQFLFYAVNVRAWLINLINGNHDLYASSLCMVDGLYRLRHYAIVRGNYKNRDIRGACATHTHSRERLMSRRIQKRDLFSVYFYYICSNVLRNSAGFPVDYIGMADRIQKGGLAVVNVAHDADYRRTLLHLLLILFFFLQKFFNYVYNFFLFAEDIELQRDLFRGLIINLLVHRNDFAL